MSSAAFVDREDRASETSLLAEAVAEGLHSLAQPLSLAQWHLEIASMSAAGTERQQSELAEALVVFERVMAHFELIRDIIRPFRRQTEYKSESLREALFDANDMQQDALQHEGVQVIFPKGLSEGIVVAPLGFVPRIAMCLFDSLRFLAPLCATFDIREADESILVLAALNYTTKRDTNITEIHGLSVISSYVKVLAGELSVADDCSSIRIMIPRTPRVGSKV